jgi:hypothetical protein
MKILKYGEVIVSEDRVLITKFSVDFEGAPYDSIVFMKKTLEWAIDRIKTDMVNGKVSDENEI